MRTLSALLLLILVPSLADAQIFRRRDRTFCPECVPSSPSAPHPGLNPEVSPETQPLPAIDKTLAELEQLIPPALRVKNRGGNCGWCALEDVMVAAGYDQFKGITQRAIAKGWHGNTISNIEAAVNEADIPVMLVKNRSTDIFRYARQEGVGVYVQIPGHALVCLGLDNDHAYMLDNNPDQSGQLKVQRWARTKFDHLWEGVACCPLRKHHPKDKQKPTPETPAKPIIDTTPQVDLKPLTSKVDELGQAVGKLTDATSKIADSVGTVNTRLTTVEERLAAAEKARCSCSGAGSTQATPPSALPAELAKVKEDLAKMKASLRQSGTINFTVTPK